MIEERKTVAGAYAKMDSHELLCSERYKGINEKLNWLLRGVVVLFFGLLGWALVQLYTLEPLRIVAQQQRPMSVGVSVQR